MKTSSSRLPREAAALLQHIELHRDGWWDRTVERLVLGSLWIADRPLGPDDILAVLRDSFHLHLTQDQFVAVLARLSSKSQLLLSPTGAYRLPEREKRALDAEIRAAEEAEQCAHEALRALAATHCPEVDPELVWTRLHSDYLGPLIHEVDGDAHRFVVGDAVTPNVILVERFLGHFNSASHTGLRTLATAFLDPANASVRAYVIRSLHARLCVEAGGLPERTLSSLKVRLGVQIRFRVFIDTNVLFPLLGLDESSVNASARELLEVIASLKQNPAVDLYVFPPTIDETSRVLAAARRALSTVPSGLNYSRAALEVNSSGLTSRFFAERVARAGNLTAEAWFKPYEDSPVKMASAKGVKLFNQSAAPLLTLPSVLDDVAMVEKWESHRKEGKGKRHEAVLHDVVLWHFVNGLRSAYIESPADARDWVLTFDYRFIAFDHHKQKRNNGTVPLCIHPTSFVQLLQFWAPRTPEFEEAVLEGFRLPFLHQEFDPEAERTSLRILSEIARFEGGDAIPVETIVGVLVNKGLRSRLKASDTKDVAEEIEWIHEALLEETRGRAEAEAGRALAAEEALRERECENAFLKNELGAKEIQLGDLQQRIESAEARLLVADAAREEQSEALRLLRESAERDSVERRARRSKATYRRMLLGIVGLSGALALCGWLVVPAGALHLTRIAAALTAFSLSFVIGHTATDRWTSAQGDVQEMRLHRFVRATRKFLWTVVVLGFGVQVAAGLYANKVQKELDDVKGNAVRPVRTPVGR